MKRSGGSRSFRSLGSRMRSFGRSLMRHYVPPEEMPPLDMFAPGWQSAAEAPLMWPEAPAANAPAAANEAEYFDAPEENIAPPAPRPRPAPARPTPAAPPPAQPPVQRKPAASDKGVQVNPILYDLLAKNDAREAQRKRIREEKMSAEIQRQADPDAAPIRRRGRMGVNYIETGTLSQGEDLPVRPPKPAAPPVESEARSAETIQPARDAAQPIQRQPQADEDDGAALFEDWNTDDDHVIGDDDEGDNGDEGGTPPPIDPPPSPMTPPGMAQRYPEASDTFTDDTGDTFAVEDDAGQPQNFADVSAPPSVVETRRPQPTVQREYQPPVPESAGDSDYFEADDDQPNDTADYSYEASESFSQPTAPPPVQREYQPTAPDNDAPNFDIDEGDTRPMSVQRAPVLPPPDFDDAPEASVPTEESGYATLTDWINAHPEAVTPTPKADVTPVQRDYQPAEASYFDDGAGGDSTVDVDAGDTRPMNVQREMPPLPSPFDDAPEAEASFADANETAFYSTPDFGADVTAAPTVNTVQRDFQPTMEAGYPETFSGDSDNFADEAAPDQPVAANPPFANPVQRQSAPEAQHDENFAADTGTYGADDRAYTAPGYDETDEGDADYFAAPEQYQDNDFYGDVNPPEIGFQSGDAPVQPIQRQPEAGYDDENFAVDDTADYQADDSEYAAPDADRFDEAGYEEFYAPEQQPDEADYTEFSAPDRDFPAAQTPEIAPPTPMNTVQRQPESVYDEPAASYDQGYAAEDNGEYGGEAQEYFPPVYHDEGEFEATETSAPQVNTPETAPPTQSIQRQPEMVYDEPASYDENYTAEDNGDYSDEAQEYVAPVYHDEGEFYAPETSAPQVNTPEAVPPTQSVQRQPETVYDESPVTEDDSGLFDLNHYAVPQTDEGEFYAPEAGVQPADAVNNIAPTQNIQREYQAAAPETSFDPAYGDADAADYAEDGYQRADEGGYNDAPDFAASVPTETVQRQPENRHDESYNADTQAYVDDGDDASLYDTNFQIEEAEFIPSARNIDAPYSQPAADNPVQRSEQSASPEPFYGDDVYQTDISALLKGSPDPRPVQRRAELPNPAPQTSYDADDSAENADDHASMDLYQAMMQSGMVAPETESSVDYGYDNGGSTVEAAPPTIQRTPETHDNNPPLDVFQAMMEQGMVQPARDDAYDTTGLNESMSPDVRADLLSLLDTKPPTPRAEMPQVKAPTNMVQRALDNDPVEQPETPEEPEKEAGADVNVDQLARDVYNALRNRLRIERERRDHKS